MLTVALFLILAAPKTPWILEYTCDSGWGELQDEVCMETNRVIETSTTTFIQEHEADRQFAKKQQAIDWIESNFAYWPISLKHGQTTLNCHVDYLDTDSLDIFRAHQKTVDCDTSDHLRERYPE
jgi:hypothetical protein